MKILWAVSLILLTATCGHANGNTSAKKDHLALVDQFVWEGAVFVKDTSLPALRNLPGLKSEVSTKERNRHYPEKVTEFKTFEYDGLQIYGYIMDSGSLGLIKVTVTKPQWKILHELNVGKEFRHVVQFLGAPDATEGQLMRYCGETECVEFETKGDAISKIRFLHYTD